MKLHLTFLFSGAVQMTAGACSFTSFSVFAISPLIPFILILAGEGWKNLQEPLLAIANNSKDRGRELIAPGAFPWNLDYLPIAIENICVILLRALDFRWRCEDGFQAAKENQTYLWRKAKYKQEGRRVKRGKERGEVQHRTLRQEGVAGHTGDRHQVRNEIEQRKEK
jgi:hypothetical protein